MLKLRYLVYAICGLSLATTALSLPRVTIDGLPDEQLARVFGEGSPGTYCKNSAACTVINTCAVGPGGGCIGNGGCTGLLNRKCVIGSYTICNQTPLKTCCVPQGCNFVRGINNTAGACQPSGVAVGAASGSRYDC